MAEKKFSDEAEFIYGLFVKHYQQGKISDHSVMIELEEYEQVIDDTAFEAALNELQEENLISEYKSFIDGSFYITLRLKCEKLLKSGIVILDSAQEVQKQSDISKSAQNVNITINGNVSGTNVIGSVQDSTVNMGFPDLDFEKIAVLVNQISENAQNIGLSDSERQLLLTDVSEIHSALVKKDSSVIQKALNHIKSLCNNAAGSLIASGIIQQISHLIP